MSIRDYIDKARRAQQAHQQKHPVQLEINPNEGVTLWASEDEQIQQWRNETVPYHDEVCWVACPHRIPFPYPDFNGWMREDGEHGEA